MCNTVPKVIAKLGHDCLQGFTKKEFIAAFLKDGYGIQKAERHWLMCLMSHAIIQTPNADDDTFISIYCPWHYMQWEKELSEVEICPVRVERDGRVTRVV